MQKRYKRRRAAVCLMIFLLVSITLVGCEATDRDSVLVVKNAVSHPEAPSTTDASTDVPSDTSAPDTTDFPALETDAPETMPAESEDPASGETDPSSEITCILNTNSKKFHLPDCSSVKTIKAENRKDYSGTRDELLAMGYAPCKRCNP